MPAFIIQRLFQSILVMLAVTLVAFVLFQFAGDPLAQLIGSDVPIDDREQLREQLGLNDPVVVQYGRFLANAVQGEFGVSYQFARPASEVIASRIPATLELSAAAAIFALVFGIALGVYSALYPRSALSKLFLAISLAGISLPSFFVGILLIYVFAVELSWFPSFGRGKVIDFGWWGTSLLSASGLRAIVLPAITLGLFQLAFLMRLVRGEMLEILRADFIKFARARGLKGRSIYLRHALKNTLIPVITVAGLQIGSLAAFAIITETVFQWPGVGLLFINAVRTVDIPVMAMYLMLVGLFFAVINLIVDLLYVAVDPRLRVDRTDVYGA